MVARKDQQGAEPSTLKLETHLGSVHLVSLHVLQIALIFQITDELPLVLIILHLILTILILGRLITHHAQLLQFLLGLNLLLAVEDRTPDILVDVERLISVGARLETGDKLLLE